MKRGDLVYSIFLPLLICAIVFIILSLAYKAYISARLWSAAKSGDVLTVKRLLASGADQTFGETEDQTLLMYSLDACQTSVARVLIEHGANVNAQSEAVLISSANCKDAQFLHQIVELTPNINAKGTDGQTALMVASQTQIENVKVLLARGADVNLRDEDGNTASKYAEYAGCTDIVRLLKQHGATTLPMHAASPHAIYTP